LPLDDTYSFGFEGLGGVLAGGGFFPGDQPMRMAPCARMVSKRASAAGSLLMASCSSVPGSRVFRVEEDGRDAGIDHGGLKLPTPGTSSVDHVAGGEHGAAGAFFLGRRVHEFQLHFGGREGHAVQFEVTGFLHLAAPDGHVRDDGLADVGLPDGDDGHAIRGSGRIDQAG
jgi:hypothetical protein